MPLRLRTKFTLITALLVLGVALLISAVFVGTLARRAITSARDDANRAALQVLGQAQKALEDASIAGRAPVSSSQEDIREYLQTELERSRGLTSELDSIIAQIPAIYEVTVADGGGMGLVSSDPNLVNRPLTARAPFSDLTSQSLFSQIRVIFGPSQFYQVQIPFGLRSSAGQAPYGEVRVTVETGLLRYQITPGLQSAGLYGLAAVLLSTLVSALVSGVLLAPLEAINRQLDSLSGGKFDARGRPKKPAAGGDELTQVQSKISRLGEQLRGVREIFSTLRENLNQVMSGLEDGLILFSSEGLAVLVSPAVEKFLGGSSDQYLGRTAAEIFPPEHPLRRVLKFSGERLEPVDGVEADLPSAPGKASGPLRVGITVHPIPDSNTEAGPVWGALVTLRDLESRELIGSELETSERLSALARITTGVAHEVKNPLNSMRLWLETLKESLPKDHEASMQAVRVLDSEIDRLDRVVKRFLDFTKPVEMRVDEVDLAPLLSRVIEVARPEIERSKVTVEMRLAEGVPPLRGDGELLRQAMLNLVLNAVEAMPGGGRLLISLDRRGDDAVIMVSDTGKGIPPEHRSRIFQLFYTTRKGGSGLGLATTFRIVQLHKGSIDFVSEVGRGTAFRIELPLVRGQSAPAEPVRAAHTAQAQSK
ncbi:MAG TPA: ATP-binding protein [Candidatus Acidoferrum sp.]|nr:ATP-binding protein [Candidatus Acidoferrum sp.]